jgi:hypothetical protein
MSSSAVKKNTATISELQRLTGFDRATIRRRLANIEPKQVKRNKKLYNLAAATKALTSSNGSGHESPSALTEARRRKIIAEAARITLHLQEERGDLVAKQEVADRLFQFIKAMYVRIAKRYPRENARRLRRCRSDAEFMSVMQGGLTLVFDELKRDFPELCMKG